MAKIDNLDILDIADTKILRAQKKGATSKIAPLYMRKKRYAYFTSSKSASWMSGPAWPPPCPASAPG